MLMWLPLSPHRVCEEVLIRQPNAIFEFGLIGPAQSCGLADIQQLSRGAVRLCGIPLDLAFIPDNLGNKLSQLPL